MVEVLLVFSSRIREAVVVPILVFLSSPSGDTHARQGASVAATCSRLKL